MSEVRVNDVTLEIDGVATIYRLAVAMVPGKITGGREIDAGHLHPVVREHLVAWAGTSAGLLAELQELQTSIVLTKPNPAEIAARLATLVERYTT